MKSESVVSNECLICLRSIIFNPKNWLMQTEKLASVLLNAGLNNKKMIITKHFLKKCSSTKNKPQSYLIIDMDLQ